MALINRITRVLLAMLIITLLPFTTSAATYSVTELGTLGGNFANPHDINNSGDIVGESTTAGGATHAFLYSGGSMTDLGTLSGSNLVARSINSSGDITGYFTTSGGSVQHPFLYSGGTLTDIMSGTPSDNGNAYAINDSGTVVGTSYTGGRHPFSYSGGIFTNLYTAGLNQYAVPYGINTSGQISGSASNAAFLFSGGSSYALATLGGNQAEGQGINLLGQIAGYSLIAGNSLHHAFVSRPTIPNATTCSVRDLGTLTGGSESFAYDVNAYGEVVGTSGYTGGAFGNHAFVFKDGQMQDLNTLIPAGTGYTLKYANAINDQGQIVCVGTTATSVQRAFLLTPL